MKNKYDFIYEDLNIKINSLQEKYDFYIKNVIKTENFQNEDEIQSFAQYEHEKKPIVNINHERKAILNDFLNSKKEVVTSLSLLGKQCLLNINWQESLTDLFKYLEEIYNPKSDCYDAYSCSFLESILPSLQMVLQSSFVDIWVL